MQSQLISIWTWFIVLKRYTKCISLWIKNIYHSLPPLFSCHLNYKPFGQDFGILLRLILTHLDQYMGLEGQNTLHGKLIELGEAGALHFSLLRLKIICCLYSQKCNGISTWFDLLLMEDTTPTDSCIIKIHTLPFDFTALTCRDVLKEIHFLYQIYKNSIFGLLSPRTVETWLFPTIKICLLCQC